MSLAKGSAVAKDVFGFRLRISTAPWEGSAPAVVWESSIPTKSAAKDEPYTMESLANREIANTSNSDVSHESSSAGVVPAQSDEIPATPSGPSTPAGMAFANSTEGAAATRGTSPQSLRPGASANVGKPVVGLTKPLGRKPTVPVTPLFRKRVPGMPAPFSSVAAEEADEKRRRRGEICHRRQTVLGPGSRTRHRNVRRKWVSSRSGRYGKRKGKQ